jgi:WD40 repeat protein
VGLKIKYKVGMQMIFFSIVIFCSIISFQELLCCGVLTELGGFNRGMHLASTSGDCTVKLWSFEKSRCIHTFSDHTQVRILYLYDCSSITGLTVLCLFISLTEVTVYLASIKNI